VAFANLVHLYRVRLRARGVQELFAMLGIAAGVALLFASQVASRSLQGSVAELSAGIVGDARLQVLASSPQGMPEGMLAAVRASSGVRAAAPLVEASAEAGGPAGSSSVEIVGVDSSLKSLGGALLAHTQLAPFAGIGAVLLTASLADRVGIERFGQEVTLQVYGRRARAPLYERLGPRRIGALSASPIVIAPLEYAQELTGLRGRVTRILVQPAPHDEAAVRARLLALAGSWGTVHDTGYDDRLFAKAASATNQSTALFALISALVGFLFAFNAVLLTVPQRRRLIVELRRDGYTSRAVVAVLALDAVVLGVAACTLGLLLGDGLTTHVFASDPGYLGSAFAVGSQRVVGWQSVAIAAGGGLLAAVVAVLSPLREALARDPLAASGVEAQASTGRLTRRAAPLAVLCLAGATALLLADPALAILGMLLLVGALLAILPLALESALSLLVHAARAITGAVAHVAAMELRAARSRALGVAATGAVAVFGAVAIQGAHADLLSGLQQASRDTNALTDLWVSPPGAYNLLRTAPFTPSAQQQGIARLPGVRAVHIYRGGLLDWGTRRIWVIAPPRQATPLLPTSQILHGSPAAATDAVHTGQAVVLSAALAQEHHLRLGERFLFPSPHPLELRLVATSTNIGWAPGAAIMSAPDYARGWGSNDASAYNVLLVPGARTAVVAGEVGRLLGRASGLSVQSAPAHRAEQDALSRQGLDRLSQIADLILIAAVLAMAAAVGSMLLQRRPRLAKLKLEGFSRRQLWATTLLESVLLVGVGCLSGAVFGLYGQQLLDRALASVINYPVVASLALAPALASFGIVLGAALAIIALPGYLASGVPAAVALQD
jgi:putative ABC transport system permease protein